VNKGPAGEYGIKFIFMNKKYFIAAYMAFFAFIALFPAVINAGVTYHSRTNTWATGSTNAFNYTTSTIAGRVLIFYASVFDDRPAYDITSVTYGSQFFTLLTKTASGPGDGTGLISEVWYLMNPTNGARAVTVTGSTAVWKNMGVLEYDGVASMGNFSLAAANAGALALTVTTGAARSWLSCFATQKNGTATMTFTNTTSGSLLASRFNKQAYYNGVSDRAQAYDVNTGAAGQWNIKTSSNRTNNMALLAAELRPAAPSVTSCAPAVGYAGGGQTVTITGANFDNGATVTMGGAAATVTYVNTTTLRIVTPIHAAGVVNVVVTNLDGQTATGTNIFTFSSFPAPIVAGCTPVSGSTLGGQSVTITGSNFVSGCTVKMGGTAATNVTFINSSTLIVTTPAHAAGAAAVAVTNPDLQVFSLASAFTFIIPPPSITVCAPAGGLTTGAQYVTITGKYFVNGCTVTFGGVPVASLTFSSTTKLIIKTPANAPGPVNVVVTNPDTQTGTQINGFTYFILPPPVVLSCLPASGSTLGGQAVTINGTLFVSGCTASFGGSVASNVVFVGSNQIIATTTGHAAGTVSVAVTNPDTQSSTLANGYTYAVPPAITTVAPASGTTAGGQTITINGTNFRAGITATIDGIPVAVTRVSTAQILATTPPHADGPVVITVSNTDYTSVTMSPGFTYDDVPPGISLNGGGASVTVTAGGAYTEAANAYDNVDADITSRMVIVITDHLGNTVPSV
jgi:hypothetical protein